MANGVPYVTWDGGAYVVRVDLDPDDAREIFYLLRNDGAAPSWWAAAERCDELRRPDPEPPSRYSGTAGSKVDAALGGGE